MDFDSVFTAGIDSRIKPTVFQWKKETNLGCVHIPVTFIYGLKSDSWLCDCRIGVLMTCSNTYAWSTDAISQHGVLSNSRYATWLCVRFMVKIVGWGNFFIFKF